MNKQNNMMITDNKQLSKRELIKILFNTLKDENGLAIRMIVREYNNKQMEKKNDYKQLRYSNKVS